jgi:hypothetical protein
LGAGQARGAPLLFCDDDVVLHPNWIREHITMYEDQDLSAVAGQVLNVGECARFEPSSFSHNQPIRTFDGLYGANFSVRKSVYESVGGSDENLGVHSYTEDQNLAHRLGKGSYRIDFCPSASLVHLIWPIGGCRISDRTQSTKEWEKSPTRNITMVEAFVELREAWTLAQGCRCSFLAATASMVRLRQKLLEGAESGAKS